MLEKPDLADSAISEVISTAYGLSIAEVNFLPLGADINTAVYRVVSAEGTPYFLKLRRGDFNTVSVELPKLLRDQGVQQVIAPLATQSGDLTTPLEQFTAMLFPFVEGYSGFERALSDQHWVAFGRALKGLHSASLPAALTNRIPRETYSAQWRESLRDFQARVAAETFSEPSAAAIADLIKQNSGIVTHLIARAEQLAAVLQAESRPFIVCHADIHVGNLLVDVQTDALYIVDWDTLIQAPVDRDLMFVGGGIGSAGHTPEQEEALFYEGYGDVEVDPVALTYYRFERIVQDFVAYCEQLLLTDEGGDDRREGLRQFSGQFLPGDVVDMAYRTEKLLPENLVTL